MTIAPTRCGWIEPLEWSLLNGTADAFDGALSGAVSLDDGEVLDRLYRRYAPELRDYFRRFETREVSSDDLVQETFLRVARYGASYDGIRPFRNWLFGIARNVGLAALSRRSDPEALDRVVLTAPGDPGTMYRTREALRELEAALGRLSESDREVIRLGRIEGRSYREVGGILGVTEGAVKVRVFRALNRLRELLRHMGNPGGWLDEH